jgi:hypothetical protein
MVGIGGWWLVSIDAPAWTLFALVGAAMVVFGLVDSPDALGQMNFASGGYGIAQIRFVAMQTCFSGRDLWLADQSSSLQFSRRCLA